MRFTTCLLGSLLLGLPLWADDPPKKLTAEERKELEAKWNESNSDGLKAYRLGKYHDAQNSFEAGLELARRAYPKEEYPKGHASLATSMTNIAAAMVSQGKFADAETLAKDALAMRRELFKGDSGYALSSLNTLGQIYQLQGRLSDAETMLKESLEMSKRI